MSLMLTRRGFLAAPAALAQTKRPPNFIVIYTDDQGIGDLGCYGARDLKTPQLDRLAARGARLTSWYSNSPVCSPSRCALFTGQHPARHGIMNFLTARAAHDVPGLPPGAVTLPGELKRAGYRTALIGKWHLGSAPECRPLKHGFDEHFGFYSGWLDYYSHRYYNLSRTAATEQIFHDLWRNEERVLQDPDYLTEMLTREAKAFIERQPKNQPFFLALTHGAPHYPMIAPKKYLDRFPASMDPDRRLHAAMIAAIDDGVGEILDLLKRRGLDRDTVIFFQADNGATSETRSDSQGRPYRGGSNAPYRGYKGGLFEGGIRMPALLSWPGVIPANSLVDEPGQTIDILPTFLEWAGRPLPPNRDGQSAVDRLTKSARTPQREFFWEYQGQLAMRRGDWKLMLGPKQGLGEEAAAPKWLSNLNQDPGETKNWLTAEPGLAGEMEIKLRAWAKSVLPRPAGN
jgi:arylsulfatase A-like enzyme